MFDTVIGEGIIVSAHNGYRPFVGSIGVENGRITYCGEKELLSSDAREFIRGAGKIVMPGLVNGHCHGDMAFAKGYADDMTLREQMEEFGKVGWFFNDLSDDDRYYSRLLTYCEALLSGTTLIMENMFWSLGGRSCEALKEAGIRGAAAEDIRYDFSRSDGFLSQAQLDEFKTECLSHDVIPVLGTLPEEEFTETRLQITERITRESGCRFTSHLAETAWRHEAAVSAMGKTPVKTLAEHKLLNERYIASHSVYVDSEDIALMSEAGVKVVSTPLCELKIADGIAPIPEMLSAGVTVAVGTDGAMWNNANDILRELRCMALLHNYNSGLGTLTPRALLDMATVNGAKLFGLENELGTLEQGKRADIITLDASSARMQPIRLGRAENVLSNLIYCAQGSDVCDVLVDGRARVRDFRLLDVDLDNIKEHVRAASDKVFSIDRDAGNNIKENLK